MCFEDQHIQYALFSTIIPPRHQMMGAYIQYKAFTDIRLRPSIAMHCHTAHYGQMGHYP